MKLKGLVWFFTIALIIISVWELSYTWAVRSYEKEVKTKAERQIRKQHPDAKGEEFTNLVKAQVEHVLDSTKDKPIYPLVGTTYQKCKENELNLGLDLQGGISVTMDVSLEGLLKSLSNNPKDARLINALNKAENDKVNSEANFIDLFANAFINQNGQGKLASLFAGPGKNVKISDDDSKVRSKIKEVAKGAINQTYKILIKRIDKFGVAQPSINLDENRGVINVELAGFQDAERVRKYLQSSANLQFWEVYRIDEISKPLTTADGNLQKFLNGISAGDTTKMDSTLQAQNQNPFFRVINPINPQQDQSGRPVYSAAIGNIALKDTSLFFSYLNNPAVQSALPSNLKFLLGVEEKSEKGDFRYFPLYAVKLIPGTDKAPLEGDAIEDSRQDYDQHGRPAIKMQMNSAGSKTWARLTSKNVGRPIAIALDDIVYTAPNVNGTIEGGNSEISGNFSVEEAQDLANLLKSGKLDAPAKIVAQQIVGPTLGQEAVKGGAMSFIIAFGIIFILMLLYYNTGGWVANIALILNLLFTIGVLTALGFTLTAPGIAGLVLTIGLAVDTNVIIFERIKEEIIKGKNYQQAVAEGYHRSLAPVIDAHITSLLTAFILVYFGLGPVLGFATTQIIGILLSLFCGILVSRLISDVWTNKNRHFNYFTKLSKIIFRHPQFKFVENRKISYIISSIVVILGVASFFHGFDEGVEFKGGRSYTVFFDKPVNTETIRHDLEKAFGENPVIKTVGDNHRLNITTSYLKEKSNADSLVELKLYEGLKSVLPATTSFSQFTEKSIQARIGIEPTISDDLKRGAVKATIFAIIIIFIYIFIRFRDWRFSIGTILSLVHDVLIICAVFSFLREVVPFPLEIDQHFIAAVLTVIGFSMNDTVIVFDRIREYSHNLHGADKTTIINRAINDTLSRTIMTSVTVFLVLLVLFLFGGEVTRGFAFAMLIGVFTGTYSSIFVGVPVLMDFAKNKPLGSVDKHHTDAKAAEALAAAKKQTKK